MTAFFVLLVCAVFVNVRGSPVLYDQRQTGDSNFRVDLEDVLLIVDYGGVDSDYEYNYDYSDLTVKPEDTPVTSTTPKPAESPTPSTTGSPSSSTTDAGQGGDNTLVLETDNHTLTINPSRQNATDSEPNKISLVHPLNTHNMQIPVVVVQEGSGAKPEKHYVSSAAIRRKPGDSSPAVDPQDLPARHCSAGFFLDSRNRCKKLKRPLRDRPQLPHGLRFPQRTEDLLKKVTSTPPPV